MQNARVSSITVFPVKALDPVEVADIMITQGGSLAWDRRYAIFDRSGRYVNGKRNPAVHLIRSDYDLRNGTIRLRRQDENAWSQFSLDAGDRDLEAWLSRHFGEPVRVGENRTAGFPDDTEAPGPTVVSAASLTEVASWFPGLDASRLRRRVRVNLVVDGVPPFWEDTLFTAGGRRRFRVGQVDIEGVNPCARCVVPTRDPETGETLQGFQQTFIHRRLETFPPGAARDRFNHYYRFTLNTFIHPSEEGKRIAVGDAVTTEGSF